AQAVAVVTIQLDESEDAYAETGDLEMALADTEGAPDAPIVPIGADDLLDMSRFLARFDGDFRSLFRDSQSADDPEPEGR
ncbi:MAG: hypothetical protein M3Q75_09030, partial [Gemmatimonadota bacterium]|nr:hypothetical protein [Gemmatimonadota bacterium]